MFLRRWKGIPAALDRAVIVWPVVYRWLGLRGQPTVPMWLSLIELSQQRLKCSGSVPAHAIQAMEFRCP